MSERTAPSLAKLEVLLPLLEQVPASPEREALLDEARALQRAVAAFHIEAIRFRIYNVDRRIKQLGGSDEVVAALEEVRHALEEAGFHTRSHAAPGS